MTGRPTGSRLRAWAELLRAPNLLTTPGDPLAGFLLAAGPASEPRAALWACAASGLLYAGGLALNDWADWREDARERPARPIPSGRVGRPRALSAAALLAAGGVGAAAVAGASCAASAVALLVLVVSYNLALKRVPALGVLNMSACRAASVLLGAFAAGRTPAAAAAVPAAAAAVLAYIAAVSLIARRETHASPYGMERWAPATCVVAGLTTVAAVQRAAPPVFLAVGATAALWAWRAGARLPRASAGSDDGVPASAVVGSMIRGLLPLQAALCAAAGPAGYPAAAVLLALFPVSAILGRRFAGS